MRSVLVAMLTACGGGQSPPDSALPIDTGPPPIDARLDNPGFITPTRVLAANVETTPDTWMEVGPADLSCLGSPDPDQATTVSVSLTTSVRDFQSDNIVAGASVSAFAGTAFDTPFAGSPQTTNGSGNVTLAIPSGTTRFGFEITGTNTLRTLALHHILSPAQATQTLPAQRSVSEATAQTLPALIGLSRTSGTALVLARFRDCQDREVSNFIATVSSLAGVASHVPGSNTFYFSSSVGLPVRHSQKSAASEDGQFMIIEIAPLAAGFVQVWGFLDATDLAANQLTLVGELALPLVADTATTATLAPRRE